MNREALDFSIRIKNFGPFRDSGSFNIGCGLNAFIGVNNAGKTAVLYALASISTSLRGKTLPYPLGSISDIIRRYKRPDTDPVIEIDVPVGIGGGEMLKGICALSPVRTVPEETDQRDVFRFVWVVGTEEVGLANIYSRVHSEGKLIERTLVNFVGRPGRAPTVFICEHPYGFEKPNPYQPLEFDAALVTSKTDLNPFKLKDPTAVPQFNLSTFENAVLLSTHRNPPARAQFNYATSLDPVAANLPQVLATLQMSSPEIENGREVFGAIEEEVRRLFPEIQRIRTEIIPGDRSGQALELEIKLDLTNGLTVPLSHSGTGIQQVLALLTGAFVGRAGSLFLLDEPHSYLHPAAERGLIGTLERLGGQRRHYFCIATHSPIFASHSRRRLYAVLASAEGISTVRSLSEAADILSALGVNNPDIFTYSRVIFVEGNSDAKVVRVISEKIMGQRLEHRLKIQPLGGDGILKNGSRAEFITLLQKANVSEVNVPLRFVLDSNDWNPDERKKLLALDDDRGSPVVHFLERPEIENYLLQPEAVLHGIRERVASRGLVVELPQVESVKRLIHNSAGRKGSEVLQEIFSKCRCDYAKNKDVDSLLSYIVENCSDFLEPLAKELSGVFGREN